MVLVPVPNRINTESWYFLAVFRDPTGNGGPSRQDSPPSGRDRLNFQIFYQGDGRPVVDRTIRVIPQLHVHHTKGLLVVEGGYESVSITEGLRSALARLRHRSPPPTESSNQGGGSKGGPRTAVLVSRPPAPPVSPRLSIPAEELIATASSALRRLHFKSSGTFRRRGGKIRIGNHSASLESQNTSTDSSNTVITMVTVTDSMEEEEIRITPNLLEDVIDPMGFVGEGEDEETRLETTTLGENHKRLRLLSRRYAKNNFQDDNPHGRGSSGFAAEQMTIDSEDSFSIDQKSPPIPDTPTKPRKSVCLEILPEKESRAATIVIQQASVTGNSPESMGNAVDESITDIEMENKREENIRLLEVANTLTEQQLHDFEMRYGSPHHSRSQSVKPRSRPNFLSLPQARCRVASMPNTGAEEQYYRLRHFSITGKGVINRGDSLRSRRSRSHTSVASTNSTNSTEQLTAVSNSSSRQSSCASCPSIVAPFRVVMLGSAAVGKTSLISQFMTSEYLHAYDTSIDDEYGEKSVSVLLDGEESELVFIDHPTAEMSPRTCLATYSSSPHAYCVVYSTSDRVSFKAAETSLQTLWKTDAIRNKAVILVANKTDLVRSRVVSTADGKQMATSYDCKFIETSVGINHNVDELLVGILTQIRLKLERPTETKRRRSRSPTAVTETPTAAKTTCGGSFKLRGTRTSASLKVKGLLSKVWARDSKSKSCENLHVL